MVEVNGFKISVMVTQLGSTDTRQPDRYNSIGVYRLAVRVCRQVIVVYGARGGHSHRRNIYNCDQGQTVKVPFVVRSSGRATKQ